MTEQMMQETAGKTIPAGYKQTEVGIIPTSWTVKIIRDLGFDISDGNYSSKYPRSDEFTLIGIPFIRANNIKGLTVVDSDMRFISEKKHNEITKGHLKKGDVLITNRGEIGNIAIVPDWHVGSNINAQIVRVNSTGTVVVSSYLAYYLQRDNVKQLLLDLQTGSALKQLPINRLVTLPIAIPTKQEQTAIANVLSDSDALIDALEQLIAKKQAIKSGTMQQLLTGRIRLPAFALRPDGTPKGYKPSELGEIPEDWEVSRLGELAHIKTGSKNNQDKVSDGNYPFFVRSENIERINSFSYDCEAILIPGEGGVGSIYHYIVGKFDAHQRVYVIREFIRCLGKYVYFQMKNSFGRHAMENSVKATVDSLRLPTFECFTLLLPSIEEQTAIATILSDMDNELQALTQKLEKARALKQGMMQQLLTGKIRLIKPSKEVIHE
ncbi:restriction endonuclease subunit S [Aeromonas veronii]|uniref:Restriction endonuclease subunit S n=1 Tax=Aeromonas caviae TaxID=648 RepID=A0AAW9F4X9_AERCA|nr:MULTISPECIES: restriction endonuclease subunit S [Aeromonas]MCJ7977298.1 restriction endonuclease subunit S [Aeromonas veronii]MDX7721530.1 restriction endonuclease subunit S [Aeromonas caviae]UOR20353.1 restriction endonuclease subunit S [Aeromonas veronii]